MIQDYQTICSNAFGLQNRLIDNCQYKQKLKVRQIKPKYEILSKHNIHHGSSQNKRNQINNNIDSEKSPKTKNSKYAFNIKYNRKYAGMLNARCSGQFYRCDK